jgi:hypothetical protein
MLHSWDPLQDIVLADSEGFCQGNQGPLTKPRLSKAKSGLDFFHVFPKKMIHKWWIFHIH